MNGNGKLSTSKISIDELNTLIAIANALHFDELKSLELDKIFVSFQFVNGKMITKPFDIKYKNVTAEVEGWTGFDQSINYLMKMNIPRKELGKDANKLMDDLTKEAEKLGLKYKLPETINVGISIGGTLSKPTVKTDLSQSGSDFVKQAKEELEKQVKKELQDQANKILAEADKQAKAIMAEANKQAKNLRDNANDAIAKVNAETNKQADKLIAEAKKQGVLAELAAKETVKQLKAESDKQINKLRDEAGKQADALINSAKSQSDKIRQEARKKSNEILQK
jgi:F0F1-type ATP synthase membrane subunit b/b'